MAMKEPASMPEDSLRKAVHYGVDLSLLVERLKLSVTERVQSHQPALELMLELRRPGEEHRRAGRPRSHRGAE
jgi:hypothetical protein